MFDSIWYDSLIKPTFAPPDCLFSPVWTILYIMIFTSLVLYFLKEADNKASGYVYFAIQMLLNFLWTPVFFWFKSIPSAFLVIILMDFFVFLTIRKFYSVSKTAGIILVPYLLWILFATYLNIGYMVLN